MEIAAQFRIKKMTPLCLVRNLERSIEFYIEKLGFEVDFVYEDFYAGMVKGGFSIHLKAVDAPRQEIQDRNPEVIFSVEHIEVLYEELLAMSATITQPLRAMPYGKEFYISDPDGNIIAFVES